MCAAFNYIVKPIIETILSESKGFSTNMVAICKIWLCSESCSWNHHFWNIFCKYRSIKFCIEIGQWDYPLWIVSFNKCAAFNYAMKPVYWNHPVQIIGLNKCGVFRYTLKPICETIFSKSYFWYKANDKT